MGLAVPVRRDVKNLDHRRRDAPPIEKQHSEAEHGPSGECGHTRLTHDPVLPGGEALHSFSILYSLFSPKFSCFPYFAALGRVRSSQEDEPMKVALAAA